MSSISTEQLAGILGRLESQRDDQEAWRMLFNVLWPRVFAASYRILRGDRALAADAAQEVFLRLYLYAHFEQFRDRPEAFPFYVHKICTNLCRSYLRQILRAPLQYESELEEVVNEGERPTASDANNPELAAMHSSQLSAFLSSLDDEDGQLAELLLDGANTTQVAERLGLSYANAAVRIHRLRKRVFNKLKLQ